MAKEKRLYSLFEKQEDKWVRITSLSFTKSNAVRIFQNQLLAPVLGYPCKGVRELRVVKDPPLDTYGNVRE